MANTKKIKPKFIDDGPSAMTDSRAMDDSSTIFQLLQKANKRVLRLFDAKQYDDNNSEENHTFGIEVLNKSDSVIEKEINNENYDIEIPETQSQEPENTQPHFVYQQSRRDGIKSLNVKNLSPIDICTLSSEGSIANVEIFKEPTARSPIHKRSGISKPNSSLRRSVFKPNVVPDFDNFVCSTPRFGEKRHQFEESVRISPIRRSSRTPEKNTNCIKVRSIADLQTSLSNNHDDGNVSGKGIEERRKSVAGNVFKVPPPNASDMSRRSSVDSFVSKKSKPGSIGEIEPALLQQYDIFVIKTPTKRSLSRLSNASSTLVTNKSNRNKHVSTNMEIDNDDSTNDQSLRKKSIDQTDYRAMTMAETPVHNNVDHNRDTMFLMKNKLAICETDDEDEAMDEEVESEIEVGNEVEIENEIEIDNDDEVMYEEEVVEEKIVLKELIYQTPKKSLFQRPGTPLEKLMLNTQGVPKKPIRLERITSSSDNDMSNNVSPSLLASFRNLPLKRKSNEKTNDTADIEITSSQLGEASLVLPKKKRKKIKELENVRKEYVELLTELKKKNKQKSQDTTVRKRTLYSRDAPSEQYESRTLRSTVANEKNKSASDIELDIEMSKIHGVFHEQVVMTEKTLTPVKKVVATKKTRTVTRSNRKAEEQYEENKTQKKKTPESEVIQSESDKKSKTKDSKKQQEVEAIRKKISYCDVPNKPHQSKHRGHTIDESDSSQDPEPVVNVITAKQQKTSESKVNRKKKSKQIDNHAYESDSSQGPEPVVDVITAKQQKTPESKVNRKKNSKQIDNHAYESDSSQGPEPVVDAVKKVTTKQQKTPELKVDRNKKSKQIDNHAYESDLSQDPEPVVDVITAKQQKTPEPKVDRHKKSKQIDNHAYESDSSQGPVPVVDVITAKQQKTPESKMNQKKNSKQIDNHAFESDSSQGPEPVVDAVKKVTTKQQKTPELKVDRNKKSKQIDNHAYESDSSQGPEPVVDAVKKVTAKQQKTPEPKVDRHKKSKQIDNHAYESDSSQDPEPVVDAITAKQQKTPESKVNRKKKSKQNDNHAYESDSSQDPKPFVPEPKVNRNKKIVNSKSKSNLINDKHLTTQIYEKPSPLCKKKFSRIVAPAGDDDDDDNDDFVFGHYKAPSKVIAPTPSVFKIPAVPKMKLTKAQRITNRELKSLKIRFDHSFIEDLDEGIDMRDGDHASSPGIYRNMYRVADCERKLRVRRLYSKPYWMNGKQQYGIRYSSNPSNEFHKENLNTEQKKMHSRIRNQHMLTNCLNLDDRQQLIDELKTVDDVNRDKRSRSSSKEPSARSKQTRKQKQQNSDSCSTDHGGFRSPDHEFVSSSDQQMPTIHESSNIEEASPFANLLKRFQDHNQHGTSSSSSESSISTRSHSKYVDVAQMEDLNFTECGDGILFGKYVDSVNCGVIQFLEGKKRDAAKTKRSNIKLFMLRGELEVLVNDEMHILKTMGFMYIHCGTKYEMRNIFKGVSMVFFMREDDNSASYGTVSSAYSTPK